MVVADTSGVARALALRMNVSASTSIQVFPIKDNSIRPTRSTATTCHGQPVHCQRWPVTSVGWSCLLAWQTSLPYSRSHIPSQFGPVPLQL